MKMTRVLATLLSVMMVLCSIPVMQVSAAAPANLATAVGEVLGYTSAVPAPSSNDWPTTNLDFTADGAADIECLNATNVTFDTTDGAVFGEEAGNLYYQPVSLSVNGVKAWSPFAISRNITFGFKLDAEGTMQVGGEDVWSSTQMRIDITPNGVLVWSSEGDKGFGEIYYVENFVDYVPGTEWNDVMVTKDATTNPGGGYSVYMKKASDASFTKVATAPFFGYARTDGNYANGGLKFDGKLAAVNYAVAYKAAGVPLNAEANLKKAVGEVLGYTNAEAAPSSNDWPSTNLDFTADGAADTQCLNATNVTFNQIDGATFGAETGKLYYEPASLSVNGVAAWSPFAISGNITFGFKLNQSGSLKVAGEDVWANTQMRLDINTNGVKVYSSEQDKGAGALYVVENLVNYKPGTEWVDVMVTKDSGTIAPGGGYSVYMKKASEATFTKVAVAPFFGYSTTYGKLAGGLKIDGNEATVRYATSYKAAGFPLDAEANLKTAVGEVLGYTNAVAVPSDANWQATDLDFTAEGAADTQCLNATNVTFSKGEGAVFGAETGKLYYEPASLSVNGVTAWSPFALTQNVTFGFKLNKSGTLKVAAEDVWTSTQMRLDITPAGVSVYSSEQDKGAGALYVVENFVDYAPGTEWVDVMVTKDSATAASGGYTVYMKKLSEKSFTKVAVAPFFGYSTNYGKLAGGLKIDGKEATVRYATSYKAAGFPLNAEANLKTAVGEVLGYSDAVPAPSNNDWVATDLDFTADGVADTQCLNAENVTFIKNEGAVFGAETGKLYYEPASLSVNQIGAWSPFGISSNITFGFKFNKSGSSLRVAGEDTWSKTQMRLDITPSGVSVYSSEEDKGAGALYVVENFVDYAPGTEWVDVMVTKDSTTAASGGYTVYMKKLSEKSFTKVATAPYFGYSTNYGKLDGGLKMDGKETTVRYATSYKAAGLPLDAEDNLKAAVGEVLGYTDAVAAVSNNDWVATDLDFTADGVANTQCLNAENVTFIKNEGAVFGAESGKLYYEPASLSVNEIGAWSPFGISNNITFGFKLSKSGSSLKVAGEDTWSATQMRLDITPNGVAVYSSEQDRGAGALYVVENLVDYKPGYEWVDVMVTKDSATAASGGYTVYMKKLSEKSFTKVAVAPFFGYSTNYGKVAGGLKMDGKEAVVRYATSYKAAGLPLDAEDNLKAAVADVLGCASVEAAESTNDWPTTNLDFAAAGAADTQCLNATNVTFSKTDGAMFGAETGTLFYEPASLSVNGVAAWSPFAISGNITFGFKLNQSGSLQVAGEDVWSNTQMRLDITTNGVKVYSSEGDKGAGALYVVENLVNYKPGTDWVDVLVTKDSATVSSGGYSVYMKKPSETTFTKVAVAPFFGYSTTYGKLEGGLKFTGKETAVRYAVAYKGEDFSSVVEESKNLTVAVGEVLGFGNAEPAESDSNWPTTNLDFTTAGVESTQCLNANNVSFSTTRGAVFGAETGKLYYQPASLSVNGVGAWSPFAISQNIVFGFRVDEGGTMQVAGEDVWARTQMCIDFTSGGVNVWAAEQNQGAGATYVVENLVDYKPGTEWNDVMITKDNASANTGGYSVYMKKATDEKFTKVAIAPYFSFHRVDGNVAGGLKFDGKKAALSYAVAYKGIGISADDKFDSIDDILGMSAGSTYAFDFDAESNFANSNGRAGFTADGYKSEEDGLTLIDPADTSSRFSFAPFGSYSPLNGTTNWTDTTYDPQALYVKAKGNFKLLIPAPKLYGRVEMDVQVGKEITIKNSANRFSYELIIQDEWTEYLIVPNDMEILGWTGTTGYTLYVKAEKATNGQWYKVKDYGYENPSTGYSKYGLAFYGVTGHIKSVRTLALTKSVDDSVSAPSETLYFSEDFDQAPDYYNITYGDVVFEDGNIVFPTTLSSMDLKFEDLKIPVGGYAEFKVQYDGVAKFDFYDGAKTISISQQSDYGTITDGNGFVGNNNTSWRIWRVARTVDGYGIYSRAEGDTGWVKHSQTVGQNSDKEPMIHFNFGTKNGSNTETMDGSGILTGDSKMAYFRIYGPSTGEAMTIVDGYTGKPLENNGIMSCPEALRISVSEEAGTLFVVSYVNGVIKDIKKLDVANDMTDGSVVLDMTTGAASDIKVLLWDDLANIKALDEAIRLYF